MKRSLVFLVGLTLLHISPVIANTALIFDIERDYISVKDFGAKADGKTDDTKAIQAALDYAQASRINIFPRFQESNIYIGATRTVVFPLGNYVISRSLRVGDYVAISGNGSILSPAQNKEKRINAIEGVAWQAIFEGLQFCNFDVALNLNNNNLDVGKIVISNCGFFSNNCAISLDARSTISLVTCNKFHYNTQVLNIVRGDKVDFCDNWVTSGTLRGTYPSQFVNNGVLHFDKNLLVPTPPASGTIEPAWINNFGSVDINDVRQGGEPGSFTLVNNFSEAQTKYPITPNAVIVRNSECYGVYGQKSDYFPPAVLRLIKIPNQIIFDGVRGLVDAKLMDYTQVNAGRAKQQNLQVNKNIVQIELRNIVGSRSFHANGSDVPETLQQFLLKSY